MKKIIATLFAAASLLVASPVAVIADTTVAAVCDDVANIPESWTRPGGFCDQNDFNHSLTGPSDSQSCVRSVTVASNDPEEAKRILIAQPIESVCCEMAYYQFAPTNGEGMVLVSYNPCSGGCASVSEDDISIQNEVRDRVLMVAC